MRHARAGRQPLPPHPEAGQAGQAGQAGRVEELGCASQAVVDAARALLARH